MREQSGQKIDDTGHNAADIALQTVEDFAGMEFAQRLPAGQHDPLKDLLPHLVHHADANLCRDPRGNGAESELSDCQTSHNPQRGKQPIPLLHLGSHRVDQVLGCDRSQKSHDNGDQPDDHKRRHTHPVFSYVVGQPHPLPQVLTYLPLIFLQLTHSVSHILPRGRTGIIIPHAPPEIKAFPCPVRFAFVNFLQEEHVEG